ncbi:hypothetical protein ADUPG1_014580, partial [Aduncisulcus paluster]
ASKLGASSSSSSSPILGKRRSASEIVSQGSPLLGDEDEQERIVLATVEHA